MLSSDGGESEVFFDSLDSLSEEGLALRCEGQMYDIWLNEPQSVMERRQNFLSGMGLAGFPAKSSQCVGLGRINECSGAVPSCSISCKNLEDENSAGERNSEANAMFDEMEQNCQAQKPNGSFENVNSASLPSVQGCEQYELVKCKKSDAAKKKMKRWWKNFVDKRKQRRGACVFDMSESNLEAPKTNRMKVKQNRKRCMEFTGLYMGQEIQAHKGFIWTMKFSPDGKYLATGGEDGVVRIWRVTSVDASAKSFTSDAKFGSNLKDGKQKLFAEKKKSPASVVIPEKFFRLKSFQIEESPLQEFHGHASDILDLAWSNSNCLISSSMDKTVRLWCVGCDHCLNVFRHGDYVTCIQFNPVDEEYFISGSIDGKVRIWGVGEKRVVDWADVRDVISAVCYQPDGKGFIVGSIAGTCRFYDASGNELQLDAEIHIRGKKRNSGNRITGIQFSQEASPRIMITSEDSKVRIFDGVDIVHKFKGLPKSGSQMSASFTSTGRHIISVGEDCRVYVWNYGGSCTPSSKQIRSVRTCEHFFSEGVSVALPWPGMGTEARDLSSSRRFTQIEEGASCRRDSERFSLGSWFFMDGACRGSSATWPEEKLPLWDAPIEGAGECENRYSEDLEQQKLIDTNDHTPLSEAWGLNIITAGWDGKLRTFHNYGLPVRL